MKRIYLVICLAVLSAAGMHAQPFRQEIAAFKKQDSVAFPRPGNILFVGSSTFRLWDNFYNYFQGYPTFNRGFGGSTLADLIRYARDIILPYRSKQILIYGGDNDLASSSAVTPQVVLNRFDTLFRMIRGRNPQVQITFVSIKPSPSRAALMPAMEQANNLIRQYLEKRPRTAFIDVYHPMLENGRPLAGLFKSDSLHMNASGYALWEKIIIPYLTK
jgi:lysophospholipase L1-like esterase